MERARAAGADRRAGQRPPCWTGSRTATAPRASSRSSRIPDLSLAALRPPAGPAGRGARGRREAGQPGRRAAVAPMRRGADAVIVGRPAHRPVQPQRGPRLAGHDLRAARSRPGPSAEVRDACSTSAAIAVLAARVDVERRLHRSRPPRAGRARARQRGGGPRRTRGTSRRASRRSACRCSGVADSLNVSITAAVLLYEARRQRAPDARSRGGRRTIRRCSSTSW